MNSRSRKGQENNEKYPTLRNARDFLTGLLFLSVIWALFSRIMTKLGIIPSNSLLGSGNSTREVTTRLSGREPVTPDMLRKAPQTDAQSTNKPKLFPEEEQPEQKDEEQHNPSPTMRRI